LPDLFQQNVDLVGEEELCEGVLGDDLEDSPILEVYIQEDLFDLVVLEVLQDLDPKLQQLLLGLLVLMTEDTYLVAYFVEVLTAEADGQDGVVAEEDPVLLVGRLDDVFDHVHEPTDPCLLPPTQVRKDQKVQNQLSFGSSLKDP